MSSASDGPFAKLPEPPYYAVIFTSVRTERDGAEYGRVADALVELAREQPGFLGVESVRDGERVGITVSYWRDEASIAAWKRLAVHLGAQRAGRERWYEHYELRVARVERAYSSETSPRAGLE
ncbi:MAG: antibiotic biosynthesis monooxygenase [Planctomycetota bacterium]|nr:antibiotic biosynthesis monooxygenase [Planctomycetota bacterium]